VIRRGIGISSPRRPGISVRSGMMIFTAALRAPIVNASQRAATRSWLSSGSPASGEGVASFSARLRASCALRAQP